MQNWIKQTSETLNICGIFNAARIKYIKILVSKKIIAKVKTYFKDWLEFRDNILKLETIMKLLKR